MPDTQPKQGGQCQQKPDCGRHCWLVWLLAARYQIVGLPGEMQKPSFDVLRRYVNVLDFWGGFQWQWLGMAQVEVGPATQSLRCRAAGGVARPATSGGERPIRAE